jgi:hypothetical protein
LLHRRDHSDGYLDQKGALSLAPKEKAMDKKAIEDLLAVGIGLMIGLLFALQF